MTRSAPHRIPSEPERSALLACLLSDAVEALERDTERARASLFRAVALVAEMPAGSSGTRRGGLTPFQAKRTVSFVEESIEKSPCLDELAINVGFSRSHFSRAFKISFGRTPHRFILERRVERAQAMMRAADSRLADVANACGFVDQAHFSRTFRRLAGLSPDLWRRTQARASPPAPS
jgi:AraC family transcriptional regulator